MKKTQLLKAAVIALAVIAASYQVTPTVAQPTAGRQSYEVWLDRQNSLPNFDDVEFLPLFTPTETPGFVDLEFNIQHKGQTWRALQFTRDKTLDATVPVGKWLLGPLGDEWPPDTINAARELHAVRLLSIEVDGNLIKADTSMIFSSPDEAFALYNVFVRFRHAGRHTLRYTWKQKRGFFFVYPFDVIGLPDPVGLGGRRVFLPGEVAGEQYDGRLVVTYNLTVQ